MFSRYMTAGLREKFDRQVLETYACPLLRAQDYWLEMATTLDVKPLSDGWYMVSYRSSVGNQAESYTRVPVKTKVVDEECKVVYITPSYFEDNYNEELMQRIEALQIQINERSADEFVESFFKVYALQYSKMLENLDSKLSDMRDLYLSDNAKAQHKAAEDEYLLDGCRGYDLLIKGFDFDMLSFDSLTVEKTSEWNYIVYCKKPDYKQEPDYKLTVSIIESDGIYLIDSIK